MSLFPSVLSPLWDWQSNSTKRRFPSTGRGCGPSAFSELCLRSTCQPTGEVCCVVGGGGPTELPTGHSRAAAESSDTVRLWPSEGAALLKVSPVLPAGRASMSPCWTLWKCVPVSLHSTGCAPQYAVGRSPVSLLSMREETAWTRTRPQNKPQEHGGRHGGGAQQPRDAEGGGAYPKPRVARGSPAQSRGPWLSPEHSPMSAAHPFPPNRF